MTFKSKTITYKLGDTFTIPDGCPYSIKILQDKGVIEVVILEQVAPVPTVKEMTQ